MKELLLPYILICWLLIKFGVIKNTATNIIRMVAIGIMIALALFFGHRYFSPADLTDSTQVRAPHTVLSTAFGNQIDKIHVDHNTYVNKGDLLYTLTGTQTRARAEAADVRLAQAERHHSQLQRAGNAIPRSDLQDAYERLQQAQEDVVIAQDQVGDLQIKAPHNGLITHVYLGEGSAMGSLHLWDTDKKFLEMRIPDQSYKRIQPGQFAEFFVDAYPGEVFRAKVHSVVEATGESQGGLLPQEQNVRGHIGLGQMPVGRTVILEMDVPEGYAMPIGATGSAWISAEKPHKVLGFIDIIGAATVRLKAFKAYFGAL